MFQSEQVWYEYKEWHDICYNALRSKINSLDISINKLKIKDENEIKVSLVLQTKHVEKLHEIVNALFKSYGHEENKQNEQYADQFNKKSIVTMFDLETIKKIKERSQAIKDKNAIHHFSPKVKDAACYASYPLKVLTPYSSKDARGLLKVSITDPNPNILLENDLLHDKSFFVSDEVLYSNFHLPTGKAKIEKVGMGVTTKPFSKIGGHAFKVERCVQNHPNLLLIDIFGTCVVSYQHGCLFETAIDIAAVTTFLLDVFPLINSSSGESSMVREVDVVISDENGKLISDKNLEHMIIDGIDSHLFLQFTKWLLRVISTTRGSPYEIPDVKEMINVVVACVFLPVTLNTLFIERSMIVQGYRTEFVLLIGRLDTFFTFDPENIMGSVGDSRFGVASRVVSHQVQWSQAIVGEVGAQVQWSQAIVGEVGAQVQWSQAIVGETTRGAGKFSSSQPDNNR
ncbi:hypothetical protein V6N12_009927 [Hibiscus sabdariffa]|uniref:Pyruvate dehydrogenase E1 component subunit beta n=1 Tax=Hibiscus sabdariffa TaxID=183260 RepID=A0ABR2EC65_9ROSI